MSKEANTLIQSLLKNKTFTSGEGEYSLIETHISWVILTGRYAYKIKKPINLGFADFSTLEKRKTFCQKELLLNQSLAKDIYLEVINISGTSLNPIINNNGTPIEYAIKMNQFNDQDSLANIIAGKRFSHEMIESLANQIANFHIKAKKVDADLEFGSYKSIKDPILQNFEQIKEFNLNNDELLILNEIENWSLKRLQELKNYITKRKENNFIKECHGDIHIGNITLYKQKITIFDCIDFNESFYKIDVINDIAFFIMDLEFNDCKHESNIFLNKYLEITGDYSGIEILKFYKIYRGVVKAKVSLFQNDSESFKNYLQFTNYLIKKEPNALIITSGLSGSGKTSLSNKLNPFLNSIQIRSDIERKREFASIKHECSNSLNSIELYSNQMNKITHEKLKNISLNLIQSGYTVIVDACFIEENIRDEFKQLANNLNIPYIILAFQIKYEKLVDRITKRNIEGKDASDATVEVLESQIKNYQPLSVDEQKFAITVDENNENNLSKILQELKIRIV